jgi:hypothetical protein
MAKKAFEPWLKIFNFSNLWRQQTKRHNLSEDKYLPYFDDYDNFPLKWHDAISKSPSATACVSTIQDFLEGADFSDPELGKKIVNSRGETFYQIHQKTCKDYGEFEGFWWHFMFDATGRITEWELLPFENCRLGRPDDRGYISKVLYNPYFGTSDYTTANKKDTIYFDTFNPTAVKAQLAASKDAYRGQVLFIGTTTALSRFYPMPEAHSAVKWMKTEAGVSDYHEDNINNGMLQPFMLIMRGNPNEPSKNPEYDSVPEQDKKTRGQEFNEVVADNFMGAKRIGNMWVQWADVPNGAYDEKPEVLTFPTNNNGDYFLTLDNQATKKITTAFKVPAVLANIHEGMTLGGDGNMVRVAVKLMQHRVIKKQRVITEAYQTVLKNFSAPYSQDIVITPYNPYPELELVDQKIWDAMTNDERRDWIEKNTDIELFDDELAATPEAPIPLPAPQQRLTNALPTAFPEKVINNVKKALAYQDKMELRCGGRGGRQVSEAIASNQNMPLKALKRIHGYLKKNSQFENASYSEGCGAIQYQAWGGKDMFDFLENELKRIDQWLN